MKKIYLSSIACLLTLLGYVNSASAQCNVDLSVNSIYLFNNPDGSSGGYQGFLCENVDSVGTIGASGYYDGDGYEIGLFSGTQMTFRADSCMGNVSLTVVDSTNTIIPGAYVAPACPAVLNFTAPYTGRFAVVMNLNGACAGGGTSLIGEIYASIDSGTTMPACPLPSNVVNDTICGAIALTVDGPAITASNEIAFSTDPMDSLVQALGFTCETPTNTLWYTFTSPVAMDSIYFISNSTSGSSYGLVMGVFTAADPSNPCDPAGLTYDTCLFGSDDFLNPGVSVTNSFGNITAGQVYVLMVTSVDAVAGEFSLQVESESLHLSVPILAGENENFIAFPNPANTDLYILNKGNAANVQVQVINTLGSIVMSQELNHFEKGHLDVTSLTGGFYSVRIISENKSEVKNIFISK